MSDARAIEAVTETLRGVVDRGVKAVAAGAVAVTHPPHEIDTTTAGLQVNLFLYQAEIDAALRNTPPTGLASGETGEPAMPLVLHYLLTPYAPGGDDIRAHRLLGGALQALHSHPLLTRADLSGAAPYSDVGRQAEQLRITWQPLEEKDIYSLWSVFQAPYRLSAAFEVRVVLIDNTRAPITPLPVLTRGADGRGPVAAASVTSPVPTVLRVRYPDGQPAATVGQQVALEGGALAATTAVRIANPALDTSVDVAPDRVDNLTVTATLPASVRAGLCRVAAVGPAGPGSEVYLAVAPTPSGLPITVGRDPAGTATVTFGCTPPIEPDQRVSLLAGGLVTAMEPVATSTTAPTFRVASAAPGSFPARLRVDGVDSLLVADRTAEPPVFDPRYTVTVT